ncbi:MAG: ComF family protein [Candidatus Portnoybacteria bacterium]|nr:ComF family protein [Candidatus Portnoybacteria bacterium]
MIYECKYRFIKDLTKPLGEILKIFLETNKLTNPVLSEVKGWQTERLTNWETDKLILIPVPLHKKRLLWRGFNQAGLIALKINEDFKIPVLNNLIFRSRHTPPQMEIKNNLEREKNIFSAFRLNSNFDLKNNPIKNNVVILIDDICTTGSTLNECAKILKPLKPKEIWGLVIARG